MMAQLTNTARSTFVVRLSQGPLYLTSTVFISIRPPPPNSTLFPYTTLFRSRPARLRADRGARAGTRQSARAARAARRARSEEHTSELQSRGHLVCRLLLEKKKSSNSRRRRGRAAGRRPLRILPGPSATHRSI